MPVSGDTRSDTFEPCTSYVDRLIADAAAGMTVELVEPTAGLPLVLVNGTSRPLPLRSDGWEVVSNLMFRCGLDVSATGIRQSGSVFSDDGVLLACVNRPFDGRLLVQLVRA